MGILISRWRKQPSTLEVLQKLHSEITSIESFRRDTMAWQKKLIGYLLAYFSLLYLAAAAVAYFRFFHHPLWQDMSSQLLLWVPFLVAPLIFLLVRRVLTWWYHRKIRRNESQLSDLVKKKAEILNDVMEKETYKVAKEILEKYAPDKLVNRSSLPSPGLAGSRNPIRASASASASGAGQTVSSPSAPKQPAAAGTSGESELRRRRLLAASQTPTARTASPTASLTGRNALTGQQQPTPSSSARPGMSRSQLPGGMMTTGAEVAEFGDRRPPPGPPLPRPVLQRERGYMDRMVEYLVGDGPSNRYALICKQCQSHNGMALKEEFEFIAYRCCYCYYWNPARKQRPVAPKLSATPLRRQSSSETSSEGEERPAALKTSVQQPVVTDVNAKKPASDQVVETKAAVNAAEAAGAVEAPVAVEAEVSLDDDDNKEEEAKSQNETEEEAKVDVAAKESEEQPQPH